MKRWRCECGEKHSTMDSVRQSYCARCRQWRELISSEPEDVQRWSPSVDARVRSSHSSLGSQPIVRRARRALGDFTTFGSKIEVVDMTNVGGGPGPRPTGHYN